MTDGIDWQWESFPEFLDALDARRYVIDLGAQVPHGAVRAYVMGERGAANEAATTHDIAAMAAIVAEGLRAGAFGFSTSRTPLHRSKSGELVPGTMVDADELYGIAEAMRDVGHGVFQFAPEHASSPTSEWSWMRELAARSGRTVSVNLSQTDQQPGAVARRARPSRRSPRRGPADRRPGRRSDGRTVDVPRRQLSPVDVPSGVPADRGAAARPSAATRCATAEVRERLIGEVPDDGGFFAKVVLGTMSQDVGGRRRRHRLRTRPGRLARRRSPRATAYRCCELVIDQLLAHDGNGMLYAPFFNYAYGDLSFNYEAHLHPSTRMGLADAGAHCRVICDGGTPTFMLTHWTRDRTRGPKLAARARRPPPDASDRRAVRARRPRPARPRDARRHQRDRLRRT